MWCLPITLILFSFTHKSTSAIEPYLSVNWDFRRLEEADIVEADIVGLITAVRYKDGKSLDFILVHKNEEKEVGHYQAISTEKTQSIKHLYSVYSSPPPWMNVKYLYKGIRLWLVFPILVILFTALAGYQR